MTYGKKRDQDWQIAADEERLDLAKTMAGALDVAYDEIGIQAMDIARTQKRALKAKRITLQKIKGTLPAGLKLPPGYRVITPSERVEVFDPELGITVVADPGETIIEHTGHDWPTILKAVDQINKTKGWQGTDKTEVNNSGAIIHMHTKMPGPDPLPQVYQHPNKEIVDGEDDNGGPDQGS